MSDELVKTGMAIAEHAAALLTHPKKQRAFFVMVSERHEKNPRVGDIVFYSSLDLHAEIELLELVLERKRLQLIDEKPQKPRVI